MLVVTASVKGSPGVTTFSVALAASWPAARRVVVEVDGSGGDLAARFGLRPSPGLVSLAAEVRSVSRPDGEAVWRHAHSIGNGLFVVPAPPAAPEATGALAAMTPSSGLAVLRRAAADPEVLVVLDCGRLDPGSPAAWLAEAPDALVVLAGARADDLSHLPSRLRTLGRGCRQRRLMLVGDGYPTAEVERELGARIAGRVPHDRRAAAALRGLGGAGRGRSPLARAAARCAHGLITAHVRTASSAPANTLASTLAAEAGPQPVAGWRPAAVSWPVTREPAAVPSANGYHPDERTDTGKDAEGSA